jgi:hypothetical protein
MKSSVFWDIRVMLCSGKITAQETRAKAELLATCFHADFLRALFFEPEDGGDVFPRNVGSLLTGYTALSQNIELFITVAVITSNPTQN